jgi:putative SOS response-associated peptidase YedK
MCNLYTTKASAGEISRFFRAQLPINFNAGEGEVYPGGQGMVVREENGQRLVESMTWGWPMPQKSKKTGNPIKPKPVNNIARLNAFPWHLIASRPDRRCLIPLTGFCEAEGEEGRKTRTWFSVHERPIFAWAGMWDYSDEWGRWYSGLMTVCNEVVRPVHTRMPVLLHEEDYERWLHGSLEDVRAFQDRCFPDEHTVMERTVDPWFRRKSAEASAEQGPLI